MQIPWFSPPSSVFNLAAPEVSTILFSVSHTLDFDEVDFDELMEVELEEEKPVVKDEAKSKGEAKVAPKVEPKMEPHDPILL